MIYEIQIDYGTGDSFHSEDIEGEPIGIVNENLEMAKENLRRIKEHYKKYSDSSDFDERYELELLLDEGVHKITPFWIGYFETLHGAKIVTLGDNDMSFELSRY